MRDVNLLVKLKGKPCCTDGRYQVKQHTLGYNHEWVFQINFRNDITWKSDI